MTTQAKRATIYLDPELNKVLRLKAAETSRSVSELVNKAVREALLEDLEDIRAFEERAGEALISYDEMVKRALHSVHPGEVLLEEFLKPMSMSQNSLALSLGVPPRRINEIVLGKRSISADTALRLAKFFDMSAEFWLGLQAQYDLDVTAEALGGRLDREVKTKTRVV